MILNDLQQRGIYALAHDEPLYLTQVERDKIAAVIDLDRVGPRYEVDPDKAATQERAAAEAAADALAQG